MARWSRERTVRGWLTGGIGEQGHRGSEGQLGAARGREGLGGGERGRDTRKACCPGMRVAGRGCPGRGGVWGWAAPRGGVGCAAGLRVGREIGLPLGGGECAAPYDTAGTGDAPIVSLTALATRRFSGPLSNRTYSAGVTVSTNSVELNSPPMRA